MQGNSESNKAGKIDWTVVIMYLILIITGWITVYAASYDFENAVSIFDISGRAGMQLIWIGTSIVIASTILLIESGYFHTYAQLLYLIGIGLLVITLIFAKDIKGSQSWLVMGPIRLQPAEFMKFIIALMLARTFDMYNFSILKRRNFFLALAVIFIPTILVIFQKETGTALVYMSFFLVLYREGLPGGILAVGLAFILYFILGLKFPDVRMGFLSQGEFISITLSLVFAISLIWSYVKRKRAMIILLSLFAVPYTIGIILHVFKIYSNWGLIAIISLILTTLFLTYLALFYRKTIFFYVLTFIVASFGFIKSVDYVFNDVIQPHQQKRIQVILGIEEDSHGAGYHVGQSKIAIGSGGLTGKGFLNGTQTKLKYVPEQDTDFIFCTIGEELGFVGSSLILLFYMIFILRLIYLAEKQPTIFARVYGYGLVSVLTFHLMVNIGMVIGIMPVIGIPLPFFSYGGSSLWGFTIMLFIFLRLDRNRKRI